MEEMNYCFPSIPPFNFPDASGKTKELSYISTRVYRFTFYVLRITFYVHGRQQCNRFSKRYRLKSLPSSKI